MKRVALAGAGEIARWWIQPLLARDDVELVAIADPDAPRARTLLEELSLDVALYPDIEAAVDATQPDVVGNLTPPGHHRAVTEAALELGCDVIVEKPLAETVEDATAVVDAAARASRTVVAMQNRRYLPPVRLMRDLVAAGEIGDVREICIDMYLSHQGRRPYLVEMASPLLGDMAIHHFDAARAVGRLEPSAVYALESTSANSWMRGAAAAVCTWELESGAVFSYRGSWISEGFRTSYDGVWRVTGTCGAIAWDGARTVSVKTVGAPDETRSYELPQPPDFGHTAALNAVLDALAAGELPETHAADNLPSVAMMCAALRSARDRRVVAIDEFLHARA